MKLFLFLVLVLLLQSTTPRCYGLDVHPDEADIRTPLAHDLGTKLATARLRQKANAAKGKLSALGVGYWDEESLAETGVSAIHLAVWCQAVSRVYLARIEDHVAYASAHRRVGAFASLPGMSTIIFQNPAENEKLAQEHENFALRYQVLAQQMKNLAARYFRLGEIVGQIFDAAAESRVTDIRRLKTVEYAEAENMHSFVEPPTVSEIESN